VRMGKVGNVKRDGLVPELDLDKAHLDKKNSQGGRGGKIE